jgi:hypothetical protein
MRFAIKSRPEHQTWAQMREVWIAADKIELEPLVDRLATLA